MKADVETETVQVGTRDVWRQAAVRSAIVSGAFTLIVAVLVVVGYVQVRVVDPLRAERQELLKLKLSEQPRDEELMRQIRELDVQVRQDRIRHESFSSRGLLVLAWGLCVFLGSAKCAATLKRKPPQPGGVGDSSGWQVRQARLARWSVGGVVVLLGIGAIMLAGAGQVNFEQAAPPSDPHPSKEAIGRDWASFRGPGGAGVSVSAGVPVRWDGATGDGIVWKTKIRLGGHNSPIVWDDRVFLSGADENGREVYCFDADSGELLWTREVKVARAGAGEAIEVMEDTGYAASTMATDGRRVYAIFANGDVVCLDFQGQKLWDRNLGVPDSLYGYASSLVAHRNRVLIQYDQGAAEDGKSRLIALDGMSGRTVWEVKRPVGGSWTSPVVVRIEGQDQLITCGNPWVIAYDPNDGGELWRLECLSGDLAPSPIYAGGYVFAIEPYGKLIAIRPGGSAVSSPSNGAGPASIAWTAQDGIPDVCSPVSDGESVFLLTTDGTLTCYKVADGTKLGEKGLGAEFWASPSLVGEHLYLQSEPGAMLIVETGPGYRQVATCDLGEKVYASCAFADGRIYIRGVHNLYCIGRGD